MEYTTKQKVSERQTAKKFRAASGLMDEGKGSS
ncbi:hypothetical protein Q666_01940 [Marinobacter sp. ES-1]|nr:hypothetical protein Q666_01940 [Marinobacter sp. ES-1]